MAHGPLDFSSPEPKAHMWAYSITRHPLSVVVVRPSSVNIFKRHLLWSHEADSYHVSNIASIGVGTNNGVLYSNHIQTLVAMVTYSCHWLIMGKKWRMAFNATSLQVFWQMFYRNIPWVVLYQRYHFCPNLWIWLVAMATVRLHLQKHIQNLLLRSHKGDKAETLQKCS